ncbi:hypothetical protein D3C80_1251900 [compost metagenome]
MDQGRDRGVGAQPQGGADPGEQEGQGQLVRQPEVFGVHHGQKQQLPAEHGGEQGRNERIVMQAGPDADQAGAGFHQGIAAGDGRAAVGAAAARQQPAEDRDHAPRRQGAAAAAAA